MGKFAAPTPSPREASTQVHSCGSARHTAGWPRSPRVAEMRVFVPAEDTRRFLRHWHTLFLAADSEPTGDEARRVEADEAGFH